MLWQFDRLCCVIDMSWAAKPDIRVLGTFWMRNKPIAQAFNSQAAINYVASRFH
jgi:hypothetical protein